MVEVKTYTPEQMESLISWEDIMIELTRPHLVGEAQALHVWHKWMFDKCYDAGLIVEMCQLRDNHSKN